MPIIKMVNVTALTATSCDFPLGVVFFDITKSATKASGEEVVVEGAAG